MPPKNPPQPNNDDISLREEQAENASADIEKNARETKASGNLQNDVNAVLGVADVAPEKTPDPTNTVPPKNAGPAPSPEVPQSQPKNVTTKNTESSKKQSVADRLFIKKDAQYPGAVQTPKQDQEESATPPQAPTPAAPSPNNPEPKQNKAPGTPSGIGPSASTENTQKDPLGEAAQQEATPTPQETAPLNPNTLQETAAPIEGSELRITDSEEPKRRTSIRTLHGDIASSVKTKKTSLASIAVAESDRRARQGKEQGVQKQKDPKKTMRIALIALGALLLLGGIGALGAVAFLQLNNGGGNTPTQTEQPLIFVNEQLSAELPETRFGTLDALIEAKDRAVGLNLGHVAKLNLTPRGTTTPLSLDGFITRLSTNIPTPLTRTFSGRYLLGIHSLPYSEYVLLIELADRESAFASMLRWEEDIAGDLPFLVREETQTTRTAPEPQNTGTTSTSTLPINEPVDVFTNRTSFVDRIIENRDVRVLLDANGDIRFGYALPRPDMLVIANNESSFIEMFDRLSGVRFTE